MLVYHFRYTSSIVPRSVYTSGKSSSAAGLTATVAKEPETGEFCIEVKIISCSLGSIKISSWMGRPLEIDAKFLPFQLIPFLCVLLFVLANLKC